MWITNAFPRVCLERQMSAYQLVFGLTWSQRDTLWSLSVTGVVLCVYVPQRRAIATKLVVLTLERGTSESSIQAICLDALL